MHLLCGLDDSAPGRNAAYVAAAIARQLDASLTLLHVSSDAPPMDESRADTCGVPVRMQVDVAGASAARAIYGAIANDVAARTGARIDLRIVSGKPTERLLSCATELDADLIVIGHTRRSRVVDMLLGEVHDRIVRQTTRPVMLVPAGASLEALRRVVLACRRSARPPVAAELAGRLARAMAASVVVTQVVPLRPRRERPTSWEVYDAARRDGRAAVTAAIGLDVEYAEYEGRVPETLAAVPADLDAGLIVIGQRRRTGWRRLIRASVACEVARRAHHPIIVVPDPAPAPAEVQAVRSRGGSPAKRIARQPAEQQPSVPRV